MRLSATRRSAASHIDGRASPRVLRVLLVLLALLRLLRVGVRSSRWQPYLVVLDVLEAARALLVAHEDAPADAQEHGDEADDDVVTTGPAWLRPPGVTRLEVLALALLFSSS